MTDGNRFAIDLIAGNSERCIHDVRGNLVSVKIEINPAHILTTLRTAQHLDVKTPGAADIANGKCEMKTRAQGL